MSKRLRLESEYVELPQEVWNLILLRLPGVMEIFRFTRLNKVFLNLIQEKTLLSLRKIYHPEIRRIPPHLLAKIPLESLELPKGDVSGHLDRSCFESMTRLTSLRLEPGCHPPPGIPWYGLRKLRMSLSSDRPRLKLLTNLESLAFVYQGLQRHVPIGLEEDDLYPTSLRQLSIKIIDSEMLTNPFVPHETISHLTNLTSLFFEYGCSVRRHEEFTSVLPNLTNLTNLLLKVGGIRFETEHFIPLANSLQSIYFVTSDGMNVDTILNCLPNLTKVSIDRWGREKFDGSSLVKLTNLKELRLLNGLTPSTRYISQLTNLKKLVLWSNYSINEECMQMFTNLESLSITNDLILSEQCLLGMTKLRKLHLCENDHFDEFMLVRSDFPLLRDYFYKPYHATSSTSSYFSDDDEQ